MKESDSLRRDALALDSISNRLLALVLRERADALCELTAYRLMYLSAFALAVELQATVTRQEEQIEQQRALWARCARQVFAPNGDEC